MISTWRRPSLPRSRPRHGPRGDGQRPSRLPPRRPISSSARSHEGSQVRDRWSDRVVIVGGGLVGPGRGAPDRTRAGGRTAAGRGRRPRGEGPVGGAIWTDRAGGFTLEGGRRFVHHQQALGRRSLPAARPGRPAHRDRRQHRRSFVVREGRLLPVPEGFVLMRPEADRADPDDPGPLAPGQAPDADGPGPARGGTTSRDESLAAFVKRRLGREALDRLVQPLVGGIYTADPNELSLRATLPQFPAMERDHGGLIPAAWPQARQARGPSERPRGRATGSSPAWSTGWTRCPRPWRRPCPPGSVRPNTAVRRISQPEPGRALASSSCSTARRSRPTACRGDRGPRLGPAARRLRPRTGPATAVDPLRVVGDRHRRLLARPGGPPARRLRRGRPGDRGPVDPGGLVPEREVPAPRAGRDGPDARLRRRGDPARAVRPRRRRDRGAGPRRIVLLLGASGDPPLLRVAGTPGRCRNTRSATSTGSRRSAAAWRAITG